jgi:hypothetical protein
MSVGQEGSEPLPNPQFKNKPNPLHLNKSTLLNIRDDTARMYAILQILTNTYPLRREREGQEQERDPRRCTGVLGARGQAASVVCKWPPPAGASCRAWCLMGACGPAGAVWPRRYQLGWLDGDSTTLPLCDNTQLRSVLILA